MDTLTEWNMLSQEYKCKSLHLDSTVTIIPKVIRMQLNSSLSIDLWWYAEGMWLIDRLICCSCPFRSCSYMSGTGTGSHQSACKCQETFNLWLIHLLWEDRWEVFVVKMTLLQTSKTQKSDDRFLKSSSFPTTFFSFFLSECAHLWPFQLKLFLSSNYIFTFLLPHMLSLLKVRRRKHLLTTLSVQSTCSIIFYVHLVLTL